MEAFYLVAFVIIGIIPAIVLTRHMYECEYMRKLLYISVLIMVAFIIYSNSFAPDVIKQLFGGFSLRSVVLLIDIYGYLIFLLYLIFYSFRETKAHFRYLEKQKLRHLKLASETTTVMNNIPKEENSQFFWADVKYLYQYKNKDYSYTRTLSRIQFPSGECIDTDNEDIRKYKPSTELRIFARRVKDDVIRKTDAWKEPDDVYHAKIDGEDIEIRKDGEKHSAEFKHRPMLEIICIEEPEETKK